MLEENRKKEKLLKQNEMVSTSETEGCALVKNLNELQTQSS